MAQLCLYRLFTSCFAQNYLGRNDWHHRPYGPSCSVSHALSFSFPSLSRLRQTVCWFPVLFSSYLPSFTPWAYYDLRALCGFRLSGALLPAWSKKLLNYRLKFTVPKETDTRQEEEGMRVTEAVQKHFAKLALRRTKRKRKPRDSRKQLLSKTGTELGNESRADVDDKAKQAVPDQNVASDDGPDATAVAEKEGNDGTKIDVNRQNSSESSVKCERCRRRGLEELPAAAQNGNPPEPTTVGRPNGDTATSSRRATEEEAKTGTLSPVQAQKAELSPGQNGSANGETLEVRKASTQTACSETSNTTVHHDPSKRHPTFSGSVESRFHELELSPFADRNAVGRISGLSSQEDPPTASRTSRRNGDANCEPGVPDERSSSDRYAQWSSESSGLQMAVSHRSSRASSAVSRRILSSSDPERRERKRSKALLGFNVSAEILGLDTLTSREEAPKLDTRVTATRGTDESGSGDSLFHRLRNAKSNLTMKRKKSVKHGLRRMKTMTNIKVEYSLGSLKGKTLEEVARLGGESILNMPNAYSPGPLCLPTCIAAPALYLQENGPSAQHLYVSPGNQAVICSLYSHYAKQVLGAMRARKIISKTTRPIDFPRGILNLEESPRKIDECLYDVATFFRLRLSELPGGILGNAYLFRVLKQIHDHNFTPELVFQDPGRKEYVWETPPSTGTRVRMIALALVSLTSDMQFELICAAFGLVSLTLEESRLRELFHSEHIHPGERSCAQCRGYPKIDVLASAFAPLLYDTSGISDSDILRESVHVENGHGQDVVAMLVSLWRLVVLQLRQWEVISIGR